jgi:SSS family solute:Na+ symporter
MQILDWTVLTCYFVLIVYIVWRSSQHQNTSADYFLAGRHVSWFAVGCSLFASNIGSEHIVGLAGSGATNGMAQAHWELHAWIMVLLAWVFVPFYYRSGVFTMPEFLEKRFDSRSRWVLSIVSLVAYVFTKVSVTVYAGAIVFQTLLPGDLRNARQRILDRRIQYGHTDRASTRSSVDCARWFTPKSPRPSSCCSAHR